MGSDYPVGQCTWYAAHEWQKRFGSQVLFFPKPPARNANVWPALAGKAGLTFQTISQMGAFLVPPGSVVCFDIGPYGHVAIVESQNPDRTLNVSEYNYAKKATFGRRENVGTALVRGYILPPQAPAPPESTPFALAMKEMRDLGVYTDLTYPSDVFAADRLAVILSRLYHLLKP